MKLKSGFSFAFNWLRAGWHKFSGPITEQSQVKPKQSKIAFDIQLNIVLVYRIEEESTPLKVGAIL